MKTKLENLESLLARTQTGSVESDGGASQNQTILPPQTLRRLLSHEKKSGLAHA